MNKAFENREYRERSLPSEFLQFNRDPAKPDAGCKPVLERTIEAAKANIRRIRGEMNRLSRDLRNEPAIDYNRLDQFQKLNDQLKGWKVYEAELSHTYNML